MTSRHRAYSGGLPIEVFNQLRSNHQADRSNSGRTSAWRCTATTGDMRAFAVQKFGEAPAIHELPIPAADGAFLIRVCYAGVNPIDFKLVEQLTAASAYPFVMGIDFAGVVERVPPGERDFHV